MPQILLDNLLFYASLALIVVSFSMGADSFLKRLLNSLAVLLSVALLLCALWRILPGDPIEQLVGERASIEQREAMAKKLGLIDENGQPSSLQRQYSFFLLEFTTLHIKSYKTDRPVFDLIQTRLPKSAILSFFAIAFAALMAFFFAAYSSIKPKGIADTTLLLFSTGILAIPRFVLGPLLIWLFAIYFSILPVSGDENGMYSFILPTLTLGVGLFATLYRLCRSTLLQIMQNTYMRTALAKGLSPFAAVIKHALKNAFLPLFTIMGLQLGAIMTGTIITEKVFNWPGLGLLLIESIQARDMPMVQSIVLLIAMIYVLINWLVDLSYALLDPRVRVV